MIRHKKITAFFYKNQLFFSFSLFLLLLTFFFLSEFDFVNNNPSTFNKK